MLASPHDEFVVAAIKDFQIVAIGHTPSKILFTDHVVFYYTKGFCCQLSNVCPIGEGGKEKTYNVNIQCK